MHFAKRHSPLTGAFSGAAGDIHSDRCTVLAQGLYCCNRTYLFYYGDLLCLFPAPYFNSWTFLK